MLCTVLATCLLLCPCLRSQDPQSQAIDAIAAFLDEIESAGLVPGCSVAVVKGEQVLLTKGIGYADPERKRAVTSDTIFYIASSTKSFTGMAIAKLHEDGELDLDEPISVMLPHVEWHEGIDPDLISLRDLLTHTHGVSNGGPVVVRLAYSGEHNPELLHHLLGEHPPARNGRDFVYGNLGYNIATIATDAFFGESWKQLLQDQLFEPLGMSSTSAWRSRLPADRLAHPFRLGPEGFEPLPFVKHDANMHSAGGTMTTSKDLARWLIANLNGGALEGEQVLPAAVVEAAHVPYATQDRNYGPFHRAGYGLGWNTGSYEGRPFIHHFGGFSGFHTHVSFMPDDHLGVVVLVNSGGAGSQVANAVSTLAYDLLLNKDVDPDERFAQLRSRLDQARERVIADRARRASRDQSLPRPLTAYVGSYANDLMGQIDLKLENGRLHAHWGLCQSVAEVFDAVKEQLRVELTGGGSVMSFVFDEGEEQATQLNIDGQTLSRIDQR